MREDYVYNGLEFHVHFFAGVDGPTRKGNYFCLAFNYPIGDFHLSEFKVPTFIMSKHAGNELHIGCEQQAVLVDIRQFIENPQGFVDVFLPAMIRLHLDESLQSSA